MIKLIINSLSFNWVVNVFNKLNCKMYGHQPEFKHEKDMFGHEYCYQRCFCKRCGERLRSLESNWIPHHYE